MAMKVCIAVPQQQRASYLWMRALVCSRVTSVCSSHTEMLWGQMLWGFPLGAAAAFASPMMVEGAQSAPQAQTSYPGGSRKTHLVLSGVANKTLGVSEGDIGWRCPVALLVRNDLYPVILPHTHARICSAGTASAMSKTTRRHL